jgi:hypothetical protein
MRDKASEILGRQWHPTDNPDAVVNIGTAENVSELASTEVGNITG